MEEKVDSAAEPEEGVGRRTLRGQARRGKERTSAAAKLRELRQSGRRLIEEYEPAEAEKIYDVVTEEEHAQIVSRRKQLEDFIVDEAGGSGYVDNGDEWWESDSVDGEHERAAKGARRLDGSLAQRRPRQKGQTAPKPAPASKINKLFTGAGIQRMARPSLQPAAQEAADEGGDFLRSLLGELKDDLLATKDRRKRPSRASDQVDAVRPKEREGAGVRTTRSADTDNVVAAPSSATYSPIDDDIGTPIDGGMELDAPAPASAPSLAGAEHAEAAARNPVADLQGSDVEDDSDGERPAPAAGKLADKPLMNWFETKSKAPPAAAKPAQPEQPSAPAPAPAPPRPAALAVARMDERLPIEQREDGTTFMRLFWLDCVEDVFNSPGTVYLIGKVWLKESARFVSCCCTVSGIERCVFLLPRARKLDASGRETDEPVAMLDVYQEIDGLLDRLSVKKFRAKEVTRRYAFERDVPAQARYMKVLYAADGAELPASTSGATFSHVFGTNTRPLELFLLKRDLMGPCWVDIESPTPATEPISWCRLEVSIGNPKQVRRTPPDADVPPPPPLTVASIALKTVMNERRHRNEIVVASIVAHHAVSQDGPTDAAERDAQVHSSVARVDGLDFPFDFKAVAHGANVEPQLTERGLLGHFVALLHSIDPDVIVGHNFLGFDLDVLLHRMSEHSVSQWSKLGRLRRKIMPKLQQGPGGSGDSTWAERQVLAGRLVCDTWVAARELIRAKSYSLKELARSVLGVAHDTIDGATIPRMFSSSDDLLGLVRHCEKEARIPLLLAHKLNVLPLAKQITCLCGNTWARTLAGGRSERNEFLLLHEFHRRKFVCPDKPSGARATRAARAAAGNADGDDDTAAAAAAAEALAALPSAKGGRRKPAYAGGLVLEPKRGFYDKYVLLLDFNSLYPSIIQEYNICFTTVKKPAPARAPGEAGGEQAQGDDDAAPEEDVVAAELPGGDCEPGVLPRVLQALVARRRQVKDLMKGESDPTKLTQLDIRQKALKLTANAMYGCLGFQNSRFYARHLAELITSKGRETLQRTVDLARNTLNLDVIYGDTDSVMINTNTTDLDEVRRIGSLVKRETNKLYRLLEIEVDGIYRTMLLLKKKKYAALAVEERPGGWHCQRETKGLDIVRRDWCALAADAGNYALDQILNGEHSRDDVVDAVHAYLQQCSASVREGRVPLEKYVINKGLTKAPQQYADAKSQPHVQVALRMLVHGKPVRAGDTVPYVMCVGETGQESPAERARHPDEVTAQPERNRIDFEWYLKQQVHPVVTRLCDPIEGTSAARLAECLGLDAAFCRTGSGARDDERDHDGGGPGRFTLSDPERFRNCAPWKGEAFPGVFRASGNSDDAATHSACIACAACGAPWPLPYLLNALVLDIRAHIADYYDGWAEEEDAQTGTVRKTRQPTLAHSSMSRQCHTEAKLRTQLVYLQRLFDVDAALKDLPANKQSLAARDIAPHRAHFAALYAKVGEYLVQSGYDTVDIGHMFRWAHAKRST